MTESALNEMFHLINKVHFNGEISTIPVVWNSRLTSTAGRCHSIRNRYTGANTPTKIDLSLGIFRNENMDAGKIRETLIHEMVHAYLLQTKNLGGHGWQFQSMMTRITGVRKNHRCHNFNTEGLGRKAQAKNVQVICDRCGVVRTRSRMPKNPDAGYTHKGCGARVTFRKASPIFG
jgi:predicted SprT family Zn-dependent metalloprotease